MFCPKDIFSAIQQFLQESQSLGFIHEFTLSQADNLFSTPEFEKTLDELRKKIHGTGKSIEHSTKAFLNESSKETSSEIDRKNTPEEQTDQNKAIVQIQVDKSEMQRRISAFKSWKRKEVEECNVQEFCSHPYLDEINPLYEQVDSCSRVDTVFMPRFGSKGHYKVSKVENRYGPILHTNTCASKKLKKEMDTEVSNPNAVSVETIEERLQAMESHLKIKSESSLRCSIIQRLKKLEDRILFLEGMSPDYLYLARPSFTSPQKKAEAEKEKLYSNLNFNDLQKRIQTIRETLKSKSSELQKN